MAGTDFLLRMRVVFDGSKIVFPPETMTAGGHKNKGFVVPRTTWAWELHGLFWSMLGVVDDRMCDPLCFPILHFLVICNGMGEGNLILKTPSGTRGFILALSTPKDVHAAPLVPNHPNDVCCLWQVEPLKGPAYESLRKFIRDREYEAIADEISSRRTSCRARNDSSSSFIYFTSIMVSRMADDDKGEVEWVLRDST